MHNYLFNFVILGPRIGGFEQTQTSNKPELQTNPKFEQI